MQTRGATGQRPDTFLPLESESTPRTSCVKRCHDTDSVMSQDSCDATQPTMSTLFEGLDTRNDLQDPTDLKQSDPPDLHEVEGNDCKGNYMLWVKGATLDNSDPDPKNPYLTAGMRNELRRLGHLLEPSVTGAGVLKGVRNASAVFFGAPVPHTLEQPLRRTQAKLWEGYGMFDQRFRSYHSNGQVLLCDKLRGVECGVECGVACNVSFLSELLHSNEAVFAAGYYNEVRRVKGFIVRKSKVPVFSRRHALPHRNGSKGSERAAERLFRRQTGKDGIDRDVAVCEIVEHWILSSLGVTPPLLFGGIVRDRVSNRDHVVQITQYRGDTLHSFMDAFHSRMVCSFHSRPKLDALLKLWNLLDEAVEKLAAAGYLHLELHSHNVLVEMDGSMVPDQVWFIDVSVSDVLHLSLDEVKPNALKALMLMHLSRSFMAWTEAICNEFCVDRHEVPWMKVHASVLQAATLTQNSARDEAKGLSDFMQLSKQEWPFFKGVEDLKDTDLGVSIRYPMAHFFIRSNMAWMAEQVKAEYEDDDNAHIDCRTHFDVSVFERALKTLDASGLPREHVKFYTEVASECITWAIWHLFENVFESCDEESWRPLLDSAAEPSTLLLCSALCILNAPTNGVSYHLQRSGRPGLAKRRKFGADLL